MQSRTIFSLKTKIALVVTIFFWSSAFVGIRASLVGYSPGALALFRFLIASVCMGFIYWRIPKKEIFPRKDLVLLLLFGALGVGCYNIFLNYGELTVSSGIASFIISQSPLMTVFLAVFFLGEGFSMLALLGTLISISGVALIMLGHDNNFSFGKGMVFVFLATVVSSLYSMLQKPFLRKYNAVDVTVFIIWGGTLVLFVYFPDLIREIKTAPLTATLSTIYLGIFPAAIAYVAWSYALSEIPVSRCVSFLYFMPVIATLLGWLCLGEVPALIALVGGFIALFGVWVANRAF